MIRDGRIPGACQRSRKLLRHGAPVSARGGTERPRPAARHRCAGRGANQAQAPGRHQHLSFCLRIARRWSGACAIAVKIPKRSSSAGWSTASREIENYDKYDYILINDQLEESMREPAGHRAFGAPAARRSAAIGAGTKNRRSGGLLSAGQRSRAGAAHPGVLWCTRSLGKLVGFAVSFNVAPERAVDRKTV